MALSYVESRDITEYRPLIAELTVELGARFAGSMENWCGIGDRPYPLPVWQVRLVQAAGGSVVGVCSYYRQTDDPPGRYWVGWIGVCRARRRQGVAAEMFRWVQGQVRTLGATALWVYAGTSSAEQFYRAMGMHDAGRFRETGLDQAAASGDEAVLMLPV